MTEKLKILTEKVIKYDYKQENRIKESIKNIDKNYLNEINKIIENSKPKPKSQFQFENPSKFDVFYFIYRFKNFIREK